MLRGSGVETDIVTGKPVAPQPQAKQGKAVERYNRATLNASEMAAALHENNAVLKVFITQYAARLDELAQADPVCQTLAASINEIRNILEVRPALAKQAALRTLGPQLVNMIKEESETET